MYASVNSLANLPVTIFTEQAAGSESIRNILFSKISAVQHYYFRAVAKLQPYSIVFLRLIESYSRSPRVFTADGVATAVVHRLFTADGVATAVLHRVFTANGVATAVLHRLFTADGVATAVLHRVFTAV